MDQAIVQQIVDELLYSLEPLETQNQALLQFLKAKGIATDEELAPFLEQAGNASNIRWRAVRVRTAALISSAMKPAEQPSQTAPATDMQHQPESKKNPEKENTDNEKSQKPEARKQDPAPAKNQQQPTHEEVAEPRPASQKPDASPSTSSQEEKAQVQPNANAPAPETQKEKAA